MRTVSDILLNGKNTPIGRLLDVEANAGWLYLLMYSAAHINVDMPVMDSVTVPHSTHQINTLHSEMGRLVNAIDRSPEAIKQLSDFDLDDVYFLSQRVADKLAVAVYTLYLYGSR